MVDDLSAPYLNLDEIMLMVHPISTEAINLLREKVNNVKIKDASGMDGKSHPSQIHRFIPEYHAPNSQQNSRTSAMSRKVNYC